MTVIVGTDGSDQALEAVREATREAARRGGALKIVHAFIWPELGVNVNPAAGVPDSGLKREAERFLALSAAIAAQTDDSVPVTVELMPGSPAAVLLTASHEAEVVVIGDRGLGGFTGLLVGSTAVQVAAHATVPVLVVKGDARTGGPVLLGVDEAAGAAVEAGFAEAERRRAGLLAVHAWSRPISTVLELGDAEGAETHVLSQALSGYADKYPDVAVTRRVVQGRPAQALIELSQEAQLVVVGSRGRGGFKGLLLGSVSQQLLHHAACPVMIVR